MTRASQENAGVGAVSMPRFRASRGRMYRPRAVPASALNSWRSVYTIALSGWVSRTRAHASSIAGAIKSSAGRFELNRLKYFNQIAYCSMFRRDMWEAIGGYRVNVSGFADWYFWIAAAARGFCGRHLVVPLLQHRRRLDSHLMQIRSDYERLFAQIILNNSAVYSEHEVAAASRFLLTGEPAPLLQLSSLIFAASYPWPPDHGSTDVSPRTQDCSDPMGATDVAGAASLHQ